MHTRLAWFERDVPRESERQEFAFALGERLVEMAAANCIARRPGRSTQRIACHRGAE